MSPELEELKEQLAALIATSITDLDARFTRALASIERERRRDRP